MLKSKFIFQFILILTALSFAGCSSDDSDSGTGADLSDTETATSADSADSDTMPPTPYDDVDCEAANQNSENCENLICMNLEFYLPLFDGCSLDTEELCTAKINCYDTLAECMKTACPPGTKVPETHDEKSEAGIYLCKSNFDSCLLMLE
ncbi:MAG: hypothetical protein JXR95_14460 [Deltaproteobacteria bacterium]|nr:hypothetical protein [Deltaproteobacteria bacterium]